MPAWIGFTVHTPRSHCFAMKDPFLYAHYLGVRIFSVSGKISPLSIRDQMIRGRMLVDRAFEQMLISKTLPLMVVGAGAGGVSAALRSAQLGVPTFLIEKERQAFSVQAACATRWIDPTQYDWPLDHWQVGQYPHPPKNPRVPLSWRGGRAVDLAAGWYGELLNIVALARLVQHTPVMLRFWRGCQLRSTPVLDSSGQILHVTLERVRTGKQYPIDVGMVILATGFGREQHYLLTNGSTQPHPIWGCAHPTWGFGFWQNDRLSEPDLGISKGTPSVLISGSGDGALQDFLRVTTTGSSAAEIYSKCRIPDDFERRLQTAQEWAHRTYSWGCRARHDHAVLKRLHSAYEQVVRNALQLANVQRALRALVRPVVPAVRLVYECDHFSAAYGLNRFLALLIGNYLESKSAAGPGSILISGHRLKDLRSDEKGHNCDYDPVECHGKRHRAKLVGFPQCWGGEGKEVVLNTPVNVLVIRHGLDQSEFHRDPTPPLFRQMLPFSLPD